MGPGIFAWRYQFLQLSGEWETNGAIHTSGFLHLVGFGCTILICLRSFKASLSLTVLFCGGMENRERWTSSRWLWAIPSAVRNLKHVKIKSHRNIHTNYKSSYFTSLPSLFFQPSQTITQTHHPPSIPPPTPKTSQPNSNHPPSKQETQPKSKNQTSSSHKPDKVSRCPLKIIFPFPNFGPSARVFGLWVRATGANARKHASAWAL